MFRKICSGLLSTGILLGTFGTAINAVEKNYMTFSVDNTQKNFSTSVILFAQAQDAAETIKQAVEGQKFSHRIDDTRDNEELGIWIGIVGVEYLLDDASLTDVKVNVNEAESSLLNKDYNISLRCKILGARYAEKHFRGIGHEYHFKHRHNPTAELEFIYRLDSDGLRPLEVNQITHDGRGRSLEQLRDGGTAKILERIKTVL